MYCNRPEVTALARRVLGLDEKQPGTRRFFYFVPAQGEPRKLVHRIETSALDELPGEKAKASESKLDRYGFHYIGSDQDFEAKQQRSTDTYFILIVMPLCLSSACKKKSRPDDTSDYNKDAENFDANTNEMDQVAYGRLEGIFHCLALRYSVANKLLRCLSPQVARSRG